MQLIERAGELGAGNLVMDDPDGVEERLVHEPPDVVGCSQVEVVEVEAGEPQCQRQRPQEVVVVDGQAGENGLRVAALALDASVLLGIQLLGDLVGVVLGEELALLRLELSQHSGTACDLLLADASQVRQVILDRLPDAALVGLGHRDRLVVILDGGLDMVDALGGLRALVALVVAADEVLVEAAVALVA